MNWAAHFIGMSQRLALGLTAYQHVDSPTGRPLFSQLFSGLIFREKKVKLKHEINLKNWKQEKKAHIKYGIPFNSIQ